MHRYWGTALLAFALAGAQTVGFAAEEQAVTNAQIEAAVKRMLDSGALDTAIERGIQRYVQRQQDARKKQQEDQQRVQAEAAKNARPVDAKRDRIFGNTGAEVSVIVYDDLECPFCKRFAGTPEQAIAKFDGKANFVLRHFPLDFHGVVAKRGAYFAECVARQAGSKAFFVFVNEWLKQTIANGQGLEGGDAKIHELAKSAGAKDLAALDACARDPAVAKLVAEDIADAVRSGINGTPGVIVRNNKTGRSIAITGAVPAETLVQGIQKALAK